MHTPEQGVNPVEHRQLPLTQVSPPEHVKPQPPQLPSLVCRSTQLPPHWVSIPEQLIVHTPAEHTSLRPHAFPHVPQLLRSLVRTAHLVPQTTLPMAQPHLPEVHVIPVAHESPQAPQLLGLLLVSTQDVPHEVSVFPHMLAHAD